MLRGAFGGVIQYMSGASTVASSARKKKVTAPRIEVHCAFLSLPYKSYNIRSDNLPVKVLAGVPTEILLYHLKSTSVSLPVLRFSE